MPYEFAGAYDAAVLDANSQLLKLVSFELVTEPGGVLAVLYTDRLRTLPVAQPFLSDAEGNVHLFTDPGRYRLRQVGFPPGEQLTVQPDPDETEGELEAHVIAPDPHPVYTTPAEAAAAAPVQSVFGRTGAVTAEQADYDTFFLTQAEGDAAYEPLLPTFTPGSVLFADGAGNIGEDNANFFWDDVNNQLIFGGDANLYRGAITPNTLQTDVLFAINRQVIGDAWLQGGIVGQPEEQFRVVSGATGPIIEFGSGVILGDLDTTLRRSSANTLLASGPFRSLGQVSAFHNLPGEVIIGIFSGDAGIRLQNDTFLRRSGAGVVKTDGDFIIGALSPTAISVGANDSGGAGFKVLRVPN